MQLVIHSPFGSRVNRAWGLALRKRFCRTFNFELQAAATEDHIVLSLTHGAQFRARRRGALPAFEHGAPGARAGAVRRADVRSALALGCAASRSPCRAFAAARRSRRRSRAWKPRICWPRCSPIRSPAPKICRARSRFRIIRWCGRPFAIASKRRWTSTGFEELLRGLESGADPRRRARSHRALAAGARGAECASVRLSRRCAAGGAAHAGGHEPPLDRCRLGRGRSGQIGPSKQSRACAMRHGPMPATRDELHDALLWLTFMTTRSAGRTPGGRPSWPSSLAQGRVVAQRGGRTATASLGGGANDARCSRRRPSSDEPRWWRSCEDAWKGWGPSRAAALADSLGLPAADDRAPRSPRSRRKASRCAAVHALGRRGGVVRATAARAHPPLHRQATARGNRTGRSARFPALPVRVAARDARGTHAGTGRRRRRCSLSSKVSRRRRAPGKPRSCRRASPSTNRSGWMSSAARDVSSGRGFAQRERGAVAERKGAAPVRATRSRCSRRRNVQGMVRAHPAPDAAQLSPRGARVYDTSRDRGASFFDEIADGVRHAAG